MERNVGGLDLLGRIAAGVLCLGLGLTILFESLLGLVPLILAIFLLVTSVVRWCPIHAVIGYDTSTDG